MTTDRRITSIVSNVRPSPIEGTNGLGLVKVALKPASGRSVTKQTVVKMDSWSDGGDGVFVPDGMLVDPSRDEFAFLARDVRKSLRWLAQVKRRKIAGVVSHGILVRKPEGAPTSEEAAALLGVVRLDDFLASRASCATTRQPDFKPLRLIPLKGGQRLLPGIEYDVHEFPHGTQATYRYDQSSNEFLVGGRRYWAKPGAGKLERRVLSESMRLMDFLIKNPGTTAHCLIFGHIPGHRYGAEPGKLFFALLDVTDAEGFSCGRGSVREVAGRCGLMALPTIKTGLVSRSGLQRLACGGSRFDIFGSPRPKQRCVIAFPRSPIMCGPTGRPGYLVRNPDWRV